MSSSPTYTGDPHDLWWKHRLVVFDVETTGLGKTGEDRVVELGFARFESGQLAQTWGTLVYPEREIPDEAAAIHGISSADVATAPAFIETLLPALPLVRGAYPCAYNADFDRKFWLLELLRASVLPLDVPIFDPALPWLDPLTWMRDRDGIWGKNKLTVACERYGLRLDNAHRATDDAVAAGRLLFEVLREEMPHVTMTELLRRQAILASEHERDRRAWFAKKGYAYE